MKLYTRKGDQGETSLLGGTRVSKTDPRVKAYGAVDELQAQLGLVRAMIREPQWAALVRRLQQDLVTACARLAAHPGAAQALTRRITAAEATWLEEQIDGLTAAHGLPTGFILPGDSTAGAAVHVSRAVCRRCERFILMLVESRIDDLGDLLVYFNRLSDLLFALAWSLDLRHCIRAIVEELLAANQRGNAPCR